MQVNLNKTTIFVLGEAKSGRTTVIQSLLKSPNWKSVKSPATIKDVVGNSLLSISTLSCTHGVRQRLFHHQHQQHHQHKTIEGMYVAL